MTALSFLVAAVFAAIAQNLGATEPLQAAAALLGIAATLAIAEAL